MRPDILIILSASLLVSAAAPARYPGSKEHVVVTDAFETYWDDGYSGKLGIQVEEATIEDGGPRMTLAGKPLYVTGVNCYNLFVQCFERDNMGVGEIEETVRTLARQEVPIVRFSCGPYYASQMGYYTDFREKYLENLDHLASLCDESHILLIPSVFWNSSCVPDYRGEPLSAWGDKDSATYSFMLEYTKDIVNTLKDHKSLAFWEFGNEFNLQADITGWGYPDLPARAVSMACEGFAELVRELDPEGRLIGSGHSIMRNAQWSLAKGASVNPDSLKADSFARYAEISALMTPEPMMGMSEHIYEEPRVFSGLDTLDRESQLAKAKEAAAMNGKVYYVGEFTGPRTAMGDSTLVKSHYDAYFNQRIQLSLVWNFALHGEIEWSFKEGDFDDIAFRYTRELNERFKETDM